MLFTTENTSVSTQTMHTEGFEMTITSHLEQEPIIVLTDSEVEGRESSIRDSALHNEGKIRSVTLSQSESGLWEWLDQPIANRSASGIFRSLWMKIRTSLGLIGHFREVREELGYIVSVAKEEHASRLREDNYFKHIYDYGREKESKGTGEGEAVL